jgi:tryptophan synthase
MPSSRISDRFEQCKKQGRAAFVSFVTAGYPEPGVTVDALLALQSSGADVIELGVPFSDPMADGATIEEASTLALKHNISLQSCFDFVKSARDKGLVVPLVFMGYYNNFLQHGLDQTCADANKFGVDGFIIVDLPAEECSEFHTKCVQHDVSLVPIIAPTSTPARMTKAVQIADTFIYVVSVLGVTGARTSVNVEAQSVVDGVKKAAEGRGISVAVGFGVSTREHVESISKYADGVVVGSKIVQKLGQGGIKAMSEFVKELSGGPMQGGSGEPAAKKALALYSNKTETWSNPSHSASPSE